VRGIKKAPPLKSITSVTKASSTSLITITCVGHGFSTGDKVFIANLSGAPQAAGGWTITKVTNDVFTLNGTNTSTYNLSPAYSLGGTVYSYTALPKSANGNTIPPGSGVTGHILIQVVDGNGNARDVTSQVLSMGMTEGEPNAIVYLQRPLWAAFTQGSRDASGVALNIGINGDPNYSNCLTDILTKTRLGVDGEIKVAAGIPAHALQRRPRSSLLSALPSQPTSMGKSRHTRSTTSPISQCSPRISAWRHMLFM